jgi:hypothetical protein
MQGFFMQFGTATHLYIAALSVYFLLKIRYNVTDDALYHRYEIWFHVIPWVVAIGSGSIGVASQMFNPPIVPEIGCWVAPFPVDCQNPGGPPCTRGYRHGAEGSLYSVILAFLWLFASFAVVLVSNILIYRTVRCQERRNEKYLGSQLQFAVPVSEPTTVFQKQHGESPPPVASDELMVTGTNENDAVDFQFDSTERESGTAPEGLVESSATLKTPNSSTNFDHTAVGARCQPTARSSAKASRAAATQSILYVSSAGFTVVWIFLPFLSYELGLPTGLTFFSVLMFSTFAPLQGVFNLMIFVRPEYLRLRGSRKDFSRLKCIRSCLFSPDSMDPRLFKSKRQSAHISASTEIRKAESHVHMVPGLGTRKVSGSNEK